MSQKSRAVLKTKFESGRTPTERDFSDVLDSGLNKVDDQLATRVIEGGEEPSVYFGVGTSDPESPVSIKNRSGAPNLIGFQKEGDEQWQIQIDPKKGATGLNIQENGKEGSNLFIQSGGKVGIGTEQPDKKLTVAGTVKAEGFEGRIKWDNLVEIPSENFIPKGGIIMWSGNKDDIPNGWILCDGNNDTPDLRDRFIVGAGNTYSQGETGGEKTVSLTINQIPSHSHSGSTSESGNHRHGVHGTNHNNTPDSVDRSTFEYGAYITNHTVTEYAGNHSHSFSTDAKGGNQPHENRPPYYALCFIMKT